MPFSGYIKSFSICYHYAIRGTEAVWIRTDRVILAAALHTYA